MTKPRIGALALLAAGILISLFVYYSQIPGNNFSGFPFKLGLDLNGGSHLVYQADVSKLKADDVNGGMETLRQVIERRVNPTGVSETIVQTETATINGQQVHKLVVELPGVTDINEAVKHIGETPVLEFKTENPNATTSAAITASSTDESRAAAYAARFQSTELTGRFLEGAQVQFDPNTNQPVVALTFNDQGKTLFDQITKNNIGKIVAIFLDGQIISAPVVQGEISDGKAIITGRFTPQEARDLANSLKYGALPVPIALIGTQSIGASLGANALAASVKAGMIGFLIISLFLIIWYRLPGLLAVVSLALYTAINLAIYKLYPVVLTSAGLAGFILSIGMAVDGNILIFERMREEFAKGLDLEAGIREGFARAWLSIRDSNLSSIITAIILYTFATSALIKGFAFVFLIGVLVSLFTAITVTRTFLLALGVKKYEGFRKFLFGHGLFGHGSHLEMNGAQDNIKK